MTMTIDLPSEIVGKVRSETLFRGLKLEANLLEKLIGSDTDCLLVNAEEHSVPSAFSRKF